MSFSTMSNGRQNGHAPTASTSTRPPPAPINFTSLLAQANSLNDAGGGDGELPQIRFGLSEIEQMSEAVAGRNRKGKARPGEGHMLLSNLGVNTAQLTHDISQLPDVDTSSQPARRRKKTNLRLPPMRDIGPSYPVGNQDVGAWGRNWHETIILSGIEYQRQRTVKNFQEQFQARMLANWEAEKARVLQEELGVTDDEMARVMNPARAASALGKSTLSGSVRRFPLAQTSMKNPDARDGGMAMHSKIIRYAGVITELNSKRLRKEPFELCQALEETTKGDSKYPTLHSSFHILGCIVHEPSLSDAPRAEPIQERQYASAYLGSPSSNHAVLLRGRLVAGGRRFLERDFEKHIDETIAKHPKEAALGGIPGVANKIRAYVDVIMRNQETKDANRPEMVDGVYLWAQVYFLFRCGYLDEALELLSTHQNSLKRDDFAFPGALKVYLSASDRRLPKAQKDQLYNDFNSHIRNSNNVDQYKYALYKIIGRFELSRKSAKVAATTEDWIWLQLCLLREAGDDGPQQQYSLEELGELVLKYGNEKFDSNGQRPFSWFNLLLFAGEFERAIAYLCSKPALRTDAVHLAIALQYYGLLRVSAPDSDILNESEEPGETRLNFTRIIKQYITPLAKPEPQTALQYAYLVALASDAPEGLGERQKNSCLELVRDIVLASRNWSRLLGTVRADGTKETGMIERDMSLLRLSDSSDYLRHVVLSAADQTALDASLIDSIELYHLAGAYDKVVETVNRALGASLSLPSSGGGSKLGLGMSGAFGGVQDLPDLAQRVYHVYENDFAKRSKVQRGAFETLGVLLQLKLGLSQFGEDRPDLALETFKKTGLLPLDNDPASIPRSATAFKTLLDQPSISSLDEIVVAAMKCLHTLSQQLKNSPYGDQGRNAQINSYKQMAQSVVQFASGLRLRLGPDVYRQLSSMSAFF